MHTVTLKADDNFYHTLNEMSSELKMTKSALIREAVNRYKEFIKEEKLKAQIKKASLLVREESLQISKELEDVNSDGF